MGLGLTQFDIIVLILLLISAGVGFARGAMREIIALVALVVGAMVAIFTLSESAPIARKFIHPDWLGLAGLISLEVAVMVGAAAALQWTRAPWQRSWTLRTASGEPRTAATG